MFHVLVCDKIYRKGLKFIFSLATFSCFCLHFSYRLKWNISETVERTINSVIYLWWLKYFDRSVKLLYHICLKLWHGVISCCKACYSHWIKTKRTMVPLPKVLNGFETPIGKSIEDRNLIVFTLLWLSDAEEVWMWKWFRYFTGE